MSLTLLRMGFLLWPVTDGKISNSDYNDICGALIKIRDILDNSEAYKK